MPGVSVLPRGRLLEVSSTAAFEIRISGGEHSANVIRQRQKRAHRNVHVTTRGRQLTVGYRRGSCGRARDRPFAAVRQPDDDQPRPSPRAPLADRIALAVQWMVRINHPDPRDSTIKRCGISTCSATTP
jgi:hypothetical protein